MPTIRFKDNGKREDHPLNTEHVHGSVEILPRDQSEKHIEEYGEMPRSIRLRFGKGSDVVSHIDIIPVAMEGKKDHYVNINVYPRKVDVHGKEYYSSMDDRITLQACNGDLQTVLAAFTTGAAKAIELQAKADAEDPAAPTGCCCNCKASH